MEPGKIVVWKNCGQGKLWSVRVYWGATRLLCWSLDSGMFAGSSRYSFSWSQEKLWYVPVFCFGWLVVKKLRFEKTWKTLVGVVVCANENWVALLFQDSLVLYSVKCKGCTFGTIFVWRLGPRARARPTQVLSRPFSRGPKALRPRNETPAHHLPQTDATNDNTLDTADKTDTPSHLESYYPYPVVVFLLYIWN